MLKCLKRGSNRGKLVQKPILDQGWGLWGFMRQQLSLGCHTKVVSYAGTLSPKTYRSSSVRNSNDGR
eukprot:6199682-Amphidinium_carterae.1